MSIPIYIFCVILKRQRKKYGVIESVVAASLAISSLIILNIFVIDGLLSKLLKTPSIIIHSKLVVVITVFLTIYSLTIFFFFWKNKYQLFLEKFESEIQNKRNSLQLISIIYVAITILLFFIVPHL